MDVGTLLVSELRFKPAGAVVQVAVAHYADGGSRFRLVPDYDVDIVSLNVFRIFLSFTEFVNRTLWFRT